MSQIFFIVQGMVLFNGLDMVRMKEDKFECLDRKEGLHADIHSGCKVNKYMSDPLLQTTIRIQITKSTT